MTRAALGRPTPQDAVARGRRADPYAGLLEAAAAVRPLLMRRMFGCWAYYDGERLVWASSARGREPWQGILVPTEREHHAALVQAIPVLRPHPVLGKWLYLPANAAEFESAAEKLAELVAAGDARVGVSPAAPGKGRSRRTGRGLSQPPPRSGPWRRQRRGKRAGTSRA